MAKTIEAEARRLDLKVKPDAIEFLLRHLGWDLSRIVNELSKCQLVVGPNRLVEKALLGGLIAPTNPAEPYQLAEYALAKQPRQAMILVSRLYKTLSEGAHVPIVSALMRQVEKVVAVRSLLDRCCSEEQIAEKTGINPYRCRLTFIPQAKKHTLEGLLGEMKALCELDLIVKGPAQSKRTQVELAVLSLAT
jgi:DNA polymerase III delta subunit